jgi:anti-sigma factor RsiW
MQLHPEDPRLTAYVLGELGPEDTAAVELAVAADPALQAKVAEMKDIQRILTNRLVQPTDKLLPRQRENIRRSARQADAATKVIPFASLQPWLIPAAAAAVLALATFILLRMPADKPLPTASDRPAPREIAQAPAPAPVAPPAPAPVAPPAPAPPAWFLPDNAAALPALDLPVTSAKANFAVISKSIHQGRQLPSPQDVRLEEILNNFPLRLHGVTAIARGPAAVWHPDERANGMTRPIATLSTEMIPCPWKPSATLLLVSLRGNDQKDCDVKITFRPDPSNVFHCRLLGFHPVEGRTPGDLPAKLPANSTSTLALVIEPSTPAGNLGSLEWSADGKAAPAIPLVRKSDAEPSDDARFAALVCTYAEWLAAGQEGVIDAEIVAALARETASTTLPADRSDFLTLIDRSLHL